MAAPLYGPAADLHLRVIDVLYEDLVLVGPAGDALDPAAPTSLAALGDHQFVLPSRPHGLRAVVEAAAARLRIQLKVRFEADSFLVLKDLVAHGLGYTILPLSSVGPREVGSLFSIAPLANPAIRRQVVLAQPPDRAVTRATQAVIELTLDEIGRMVRAGDWKAFMSQPRSRAP